MQTLWISSQVICALLSEHFYGDFLNFRDLENYQKNGNTLDRNMYTMYLFM